MAIKSYSDITTNIPNMFLDSGAPTAPPRTDPAASRAPPAPLGRYRDVFFIKKTFGPDVVLFFTN